MFTVSSARNNSANLKTTSDQFSFIVQVDLNLLKVFYSFEKNRRLDSIVIFFCLRMNFARSVCAIIQAKHAGKNELIYVVTDVCECLRAAKLSFLDTYMYSCALDRQTIYICRKSQLIGVVDSFYSVFNIFVQRKCAPVTDCYGDYMSTTMTMRRLSETDNSKNATKFITNAHYTCRKRGMSHRDPFVWLSLLVPFNRTDRPTDRPADQQIQPIRHKYCETKGMAHAYKTIRWLAIQKYSFTGLKQKKKQQIN